MPLRSCNKRIRETRLLVKFVSDSNSGVISDLSTNCDFFLKDHRNEHPNTLNKASVSTPKVITLDDSEEEGIYEKCNTDENENPEKDDIGLLPEDSDTDQEDSASEEQPRKHLGCK